MPADPTPTEPSPGNLSTGDQTSPTSPPQHAAQPEPAAAVDDLQADIEQTRAQLGNTVEALASKLDVAGQMKQKIADTQAHAADAFSDTRDTVVGKAHKVQSAARNAVVDETGAVRRTVPIGAAAVVAVALVAGTVLWRRR